MNTIRVSVVTHASGLEALRPTWDDLVSKSRTASIFLDADWLFAWWRHYGPGNDLRVVVAREQDRIVGILPLYIQRVRVFRRIPVGILRFIGSGGDTSPDDLDALLDPRHETEAAHAMAEHVLVTKDGWDVLCITDMSAESAFKSTIEAGLRAGPVKNFSSGTSARIAFLNLETSWEDYLNRQSPARRYLIRRKRRAIEQQPGAHFHRVEDAGELDATIDRLVELHNLRWEERAEHHSFSSGTYIAFHREVMHQLFRADRLRLYCLAFGSETVAILYCYRFRNKVFFFQSGFDPAHSKLSPGLVLMSHAIEDAMAEGNETFDMLRGEYDYKTQWAPGLRETYYVQAERPTAGALAYRLRREWMPALKRYLRDKMGAATGAEGPRAKEVAEGSGGGHGA